jgi:hypothetical protein
VQFLVQQDNYPTLPYAQALERLRSAGDHSAILYPQWFSDVDGKSFVPAQVIQTMRELFIFI